MVNELLHSEHANVAFPITQHEDVMDFNKLIFAAQLRELASGLRAKAKHEHYISLDPSLAKEAKENLVAAWEAEHPLNLYLVDAMEKLEEIAELLDDRARSQAAFAT